MRWSLLKHANNKAWTGMCGSKVMECLLSYKDPPNVLDKFCTFSEFIALGCFVWVGSHSLC